MYFFKYGMQININISASEHQGEKKTAPIIKINSSNLMVH
jgi:hypothetical protein